MKLYVFNPDSDMALAHNDENYMAPAPIRQMEQDLALLPMWYAQPGSAVLAPSAYNAAYLNAMQQIFSLPIQLITEPELPEYAEVQVMPWGWNLAIRKRLLSGGILEWKLPSAKRLVRYRRLSSRETYMDILDVFDYENEIWSCGQSYRLPYLSCCKEFVEEFKSCVLTQLSSNLLIFPAIQSFSFFCTKFGYYKFSFSLMALFYILVFCKYHKLSPLALCTSLTLSSLPVY